MTKPLQPRYKFTFPGREAPYGVTDYPTGGRWSEKRTPVLCYSGWHIPADGKLSYWIKPELWEVRVKGQHVGDNDKEAWEQIRFVRKIEAWNVDGMMEFVKFCRPNDWQRYAKYSYAASYAAAASYAYTSRLSQSAWIIENIINANGGSSSGS